MIKLFRNIRQNLLAEGKMSKYFKYAIGEIILVVIGILIALSINNWNEERKTQNTIKGIYAIVKSDLESDIITINGILSNTKRDSIFKRIINKEMTYDDYVNCGYCASLLGGFPDIKLKTRGLKLLEENSAFFNSNQDSLSIKIIDFYANYNTEIDVAVEEATKDYNDNRYYFKKMPWFEDFESRKFNEELTKYALSSVDYRNRIISFYNLYYKSYLGNLKKYKEEALVFIETINTTLK
jgi:hypothetical protein